MRWLGRFVQLSVLALFVTVYMYRVVHKSTQKSIFTDTDSIPAKNVGLLLGTAKYVRSGHINQFYKYRIEAAVKLYKAEKIKYILISGDNGSKNYDEPTTMRDDLIAAGIPAAAIYLDYAGFRTLDSVVRCKKVFGQTDITIISQDFHNRRALYLAQNNGLNAVAYNAQSVGSRYGLKTHIREYLARAKMFLDIWFGKKPKFLGEKVRIS